MIVTVSDIRQTSMTGALVIQRKICLSSETRTTDRPAFFPTDTFLITGGLSLLFAFFEPRSVHARSKCAPRILFLPGFPFTTCLSCACYLRLFTARHSCLINKLQLIAHAAVERIIRQSSASQLGYVRLVLISATLYIQ